MKHIFSLLISFLLFLPLHANEHKYYISITEITHNAQNQRLQINLKVFFDDLQEALYIEDGEKIVEVEQSKIAIQNYINRHLSIVIDGERKPLVFQKYEHQVDALWWHMYVEEVDEIQEEIKIKNSIFLTLFSSQTNLINYFPASNKKAKGLLLNRQKQEGTIQLHL